MARHKRATAKAASGRVCVAQKSREPIIAWNSRSSFTVGSLSDDRALVTSLGCTIRRMDPYGKCYIHTMADECDQVYTLAHPRQMDLYEKAFLTPGVHARALNFATEDLFNTALRCLVYMGQTRRQGMLYSRHAADAQQLIAYSDSAWAVHRSTTGTTLQLAGGSILAASCKEDCTASSSTQADITAASATSNDVLYGRGLCNELGMPMADPTPMVVDAQNVLVHTQNFVSTRQTCHIERRELIVREREVRGDIKCTKVHTSLNLADMLTKVLDGVPFEALRAGLMNVARAAVALGPHRRSRARERAWVGYATGGRWLVWSGRHRRAVLS